MEADNASNHAEVNGSHDANGVAVTPNDANMTPEQRDAYLQRAREVGWTDTTALDYEELQTGGSNTIWGGASQRYEWQDDFGDVGPEVPELESQLFGGEFRMQKGEHLEALNLEVSTEGPTQLAPSVRFEDAGLHPIVMRNLQLAGYDRPTPIQCFAMPAIFLGSDLVAIAQAGSGKTAAYLIPIISKLMGKADRLQGPKPNRTAPGYNASLAEHKVRAEPLVVIVVPTRELAVQVFDEARRMCYRSKLRPCVAYGGLPMNLTRDELGAGCDVLIATPGRLCDLMEKPHILTMSRVKYTVIDEADEMLDQDWSEELNKIMAGGDTNEDADHVYMMFSATFPKAARAMAREYMASDYYRVRIGRAGQAHKNIRQTIVWADQEQKREAVYDLLFQMEPARTFVFCNSKFQVDLLDDFLYNRGLPTTSIHAGRSQREREDAMRAFRTGRAPILVATGISARGWDIHGCKHVINYDLPSGMYGGITEYIHRIGRTARIGHQGLATSLYNDRNEDIAQDLVNVLVECDCPVPDFLQEYTPEDGKVNFDDDSDEENETDAAAGSGDAVDGENGVAVTNGGGAASDDAAAADTAADTGFAADNSAGGAAVTAGW